jgi:hypothetical protein
MGPAEYQEKLDQAILDLESKSRNSGAAFDFLRSLNTDPHAVAVKSFLPALKSESSDLRGLAAFALGRFGRGNPEVFEALKAAFESEKDRYFTASAILHGLATLQTPVAARFVVEVLKDALATNQDNAGMNQHNPAIDWALNAIGVLGLAVANEMISIQELIVTNPDHLDELKPCYRKVCKNMSQLYEAFRRDGYNHIKGDFLEYRDLRPQAGEKFQDVTVVADQRAEFLTLPRHSAAIDLDDVPEEYRQEVRIVILEKPNNDYLVVAVADWMTKLTLSSKIEEFGRAAIQSMIQSGLSTERVQFGIFRPTDQHQPFTGFTLVMKNGSPSIGRFSSEKEFDDWCGGDSSGVRALLSRAPVASLDLQEYAQATIQDERIKQIYKQQLALSPESRIEYSELVSDFSEEVRSTRRGERVLRENGSVFADSFDTGKNAEFFGATVPNEVKDHIIRCEHIYSISNDSNIHPDSIAWPSLFDLPFEFFRSEVRPHELGWPSSDYAKLLELDPRSHGVVLLVGRGENGELWRITNVPMTVYNISSGFSWGYSGSGPHELALNILNYFVAPGSDGLQERELQSPYWGSRKRTFASDTAVKLSSSFREEFIENLPLYGGIISADRIRQWILASLQK